MEETFKTTIDDKEVEYIILEKCYYNKNTYIIYYERNNMNELYASKYKIEDNKLILDEINTNEEWEYLEKIMENYNE